MILNIKNHGNYNIDNIVFDYNGTIAKGGHIFVEKELEELAKKFNVYILTGNTFNHFTQPKGVEVIIAKTAEDKLHALKKIGFNAIAIGNGSIDYKMLKHAEIGIAVIEDEGCSTKAILNSDIIVKSIHHVFELLDDPRKIIATLRS